MSELLLKGATMTNKHHDCGSPIFRWQGEEFCPTCQGTPDGEGVAEVEADEETGEPVDVTAAGERQAAEEPTPETTNGAPEPTPDPEPEPKSEPEPRAQQSTPEPSRPPATTAANRPTEPAGDLAEARASLTRTLTSLAKRAETTDDVSKQRDLLAAATEAAEALEAAKRADR
jgi:uncharacterized Zn finger protein (UPF0148 family)